MLRTIAASPAEMAVCALEYCIASICWPGLIFSAEMYLVQEEERDVLRGTRSLAIGELCTPAPLFIARLHLSRKTMHDMQLCTLWRHHPFSSQ